ncbi:MAG TPA: hypothetical protein VF498_08455 [Anaerolineales bacterium]
MSNKTLAIGLIVLGVLILAVVFLAGPLGLASNTFGTRKILGAVVGAVVLLAGLGLSFLRRQS